MSRDDDRVFHLMGEPSGSLDDDERAALDDLRNLLGDPAVWEDPDPALEDAVVAAITSDTRGGRGTDGGRRVVSRQMPRRLVVVAAAAAVIVVAALAVANPFTDTAPAPQFAVSLSPVGEADVSGSATLTRTPSGWKIVLDARGLPRLENGRYYEARLSAQGGIAVSIGTFNEGNDVTLWAGVPPRDYRRLTVTAERVGAPPGSGVTVLAGTVRPADR